MSISSLNELVMGNWPGSDPELVPRAYEFARKAHGNQQRLDGSPYIGHPVAVAEILGEIEADPPSVAAALLHDVLEDTAVTPRELQAEFEPPVPTLVEGVTKLTRTNFRTHQEEQASNLRKMFVAMAEDVRVILIKLADRLHNMRTIAPLAEERQRAIAEETLFIYAPLAHRLGVRRVKWELEDLAFSVLEPEAYEDLARRIGANRKEREAFIARATTALQAALTEAGVTASVEGRPKHLHSVYQKMQDQAIDFEQVGDLAALRVLVGTVPECYGALGIVHKLWIPITGYFSDYVAKPKSNGYQSLHTRVLGLDGQPMEVQIRTHEMHRVAEHGIAAHWRYKEGGRPSRFDEQMIEWLKRLADLESQLPEKHEWLEMVRLDLFKDEVFVFTPQWDVIDLPAGAGPLDFAYRIHSELGSHCAGAKVNGKLVSLDYKFRNGDIVEIITLPHARPSLDWLNLTVSPSAKSKVRRYLRGQVREENITAGREAVERAIRRLPPAERARLNLDLLPDIARSFNLPDADSVWAAVGFGEIEPETLLQRLLPGEKPGTLAEEVQSFRELAEPAAEPAAHTSVNLGRLAGLAARRARCCNPLPGDPVVGYITRGQGLAIHHTDCKNLRHRAEREPERVHKITWDQVHSTETYRANVEVAALDRVGLLSHITAIVSDMGMNIASATVDAERSNVATIRLAIDVENRADLSRLIERLGSLIDVISARPVSAPTPRPPAPSPRRRRRVARRH